MKILSWLVLVEVANTFHVLEFPEYQRNFHKQYKNARDQRLHEASYKTNRLFIDEQNFRFSQGRSLFKVGSNIFADMSHEEFVKMTSGVKAEPSVG